MARNRAKHKGRKDSGSFIQLPHAVINHPNFSKLKPNEIKLLIDLLSQYYGKNNGDFTAAWTVMKEKGWHSKDTLNRALKGLLASGFIVKTRQGYYGRCSLFGVTFHEIHECKGKLDIQPTTTALGWWKTGPPN